MEVRRRRAEVAQHATALIAPPTASHPGFWASVVDAIVWAVTAVAQVLRGLLHGPQEPATEEDLLGEEEEGDAEAAESSTVLGYLDAGRIAVTLERRPKWRFLSLSCDEGDVAAQAALRHAAAAYAFLHPARHARILRCISPGPPIHLALAPLGSVRGFLGAHPSYAVPAHAQLPPRHARLSLPLHWLLQTTSALEFLHARKLTHGSLSPGALLLDGRLDVVLANLTAATYNGVNNGVPRRRAFGFPVEALRYDYFDGEPSANSQALGLAADVFDFASLAYTLLVGRPPAWELPAGDGTWALEELHEALDLRAPDLGDDIVVGYVVRDAWCLIYEEGKTLREDFLHALSRHGFTVVGDEIAGVREACAELLRGGCTPVWEF